MGSSSSVRPTGNVYALDAATGAVQWKKTELDRFAARPHSSSHSSGPLVVTGSKYGTVRGLDAATGVERWSYKTGDRITGSPAILTERGSARVFVASYDRFLASLDARMARRIWHFRCRGGLYSSPALIASGGEARRLSWMGPHVARRCARRRRAALFCLHRQALWKSLGWTTAIGRRPWQDAFTAIGWALWAATTAPCALCAGEADRAAPVLRSNRWFWCPSLWC